MSVVDLALAYKRTNLVGKKMKTTLRICVCPPIYLAGAWIFVFKYDKLLFRWIDFINASLRSMASCMNKIMVIVLSIVAQNIRENSKQMTNI